ncbi:hypothetical protein L1049_012289 [Liquidambar formosana]|uniref:HMA domain-containing protein n=1 Tax=Liquidambar formosana TaxID=63359 RepID=A0AAP0RZL4_LIQFO
MVVLELFNVYLSKGNTKGILSCFCGQVYITEHCCFFTALSVKHMTVVLKVGMSCEGCSGAVKRVLGKMEGVESFDIDMKAQKVTVKGNVQPDAVLQTVSKTGKKTSFWEEAPAEADAKPTEAVAVA